MLPEIQSAFVKGIVEKQEVVDAKFRIYIHDLVKIEDIVSIGGPGSFKEGINFYFLRTKYKKEYREILREMNPQRKYVSTINPDEKLSMAIVEIEEDRKV